MSQLRVSNAVYGTHYLNIISFTGPVYGTLTSAQTKNRNDHFPIKTDQSDIIFVAMFRGEKEYESFQKFVRNVQQQAVTSSVNATAPLTLNWAERSINNWTGFISEFEAGGERFNWAPVIRFTVTLIDSLVSQRTTGSSFGATVSSIVGDLTNLNITGALGNLLLAGESALITPPARVNR